MLLFALMCCAIPALALDPARPLRSLNRQTWDTESGLPQNTVHSIAQDSNGYLWFATDSGLVRFNSAEFAVFNHANTPALPSDLIRDLFRDASGTLWISTASGLVLKDSSGFHPLVAHGNLPDNDVSFVRQQDGGAMWIVTSTGVAAFKDGALTSYPIASITALAFSKDGGAWLGAPDSLVQLRNGSQHTWKLPSVRSVCLDPSATIWVSSRDGLYKLDSSGDLSPAPDATLRGITNLLCDAQGRVWAGSNAGLLLVDHGSRHNFSTREGLPGDRIHSVHQDSSGAIWISTNRGLVRWANGALSSNASSGEASGVVPINTALSMYDDREGNLWLGTDADGVAVLRDRKFLAYTSKQGLPDDRVTAVLQDRSGTVWIGTRDSGVSAYRDGVFKTYGSADGLASDVVLALAADTSGRVWIGTPDGLNIFDGGKISLLTSADGLADDFVRSLYQDSAGAMWVGTRRGLSRFQDGRFKNFSVADGLPSDLIGAIVEDRNHDLWIGTLHGLSRYSQGKFTNYSGAQGLSAQAVTSLHEDSQGVLWVGTEGGLFRLKDAKVFSFAARDDLPRTIYAIAEDTSSYLWLASPKGIYRVSRNDLNTVADGAAPNLALDLKVASYDTADGMPTRECTSGAHPAAWRMQDGSLWFSTVKGIAAVQPGDLSENTVPPPVTVERVVVDDVPESSANAPQIASGHSRLFFQFAAMSYTAPEKVRYKYRLEGVDRAWVFTADRQSATYANLRPGNYTFHVIAASNDGVWNTTGADFDFRLKPAFYQTLWFYALCILLAAFLAYQLYELRLRYVRARFSAALEERQRIAREIHDTLAQGFVGISVQLELISKLLSVAPQQAREHLDQTRRLVRDSIAEARRSIWNLRSPEESTLPAELAAAVKRIAQGTPVNATVNVRGSYHSLPKAVEEEFLKIAQEATTNAVRHANARHLEVELSFGSAVRLTVRDDGRGFDARSFSSATAGHYGLTGMRERARKINAEFTIESSPGTGTQITVEAELKTLEEVHA